MFCEGVFRACLRFVSGGRRGVSVVDPFGFFFRFLLFLSGRSVLDGVGVADEGLLCLSLLVSKNEAVGRLLMSKGLLLAARRLGFGGVVGPGTEVRRCFCSEAGAGGEGMLPLRSRAGAGRGGDPGTAHRPDVVAAEVLSTTDGFRFGGEGWLRQRLLAPRCLTSCFSCGGGASSLAVVPMEAGSGGISGVTAFGTVFGAGGDRRGIGEARGCGTGFAFVRSGGAGRGHGEASLIRARDWSSVRPAAAPANGGFEGSGGTFGAGSQERIGGSDFSSQSAGLLLLTAAP